jgi:hypothetical protein
MRSRVQLPLIVGAVTLALAGCVGGAPSVVPTVTPTRPQLTLTYFALPEGVETNDSRGGDYIEGVTGDFPTEQGTLTYNEGGCVGIEMQTGFLPIAFPSGAEALPDGGGVIVPLAGDGAMATFAFGSRLNAATGVISADLAIDLAAACETEQLAVVSWG